MHDPDGHFRGRALTKRIVGGLSRRIIGLEFDELLALGCGVVREIPADAAAPGSSFRRNVALTFDDGPSAHSTPKILDALDRHGACATFFFLSHNARRHPALARAAADRGHEVGCHGEGHLDFHWERPSRIAEDLRRCKATLEDIVGRPVSALRAPYGHFRWDVAPIARRLGFSALVGWSVAPRWNETSAAAIVDYVATRARAGSIILLHDATGLIEEDAHGWNAAVVAAIDPLLERLRGGGFGFGFVR
jgi:peptidoglycan/xylan/chitin deacetylase (PgdA/CDA1 family)